MRYLKKQLAGDINVDEEHPSTLSRYLMERILSADNSNYSIKVELQQPLVGYRGAGSFFSARGGGNIRS